MAVVNVHINRSTSPDMFRVLGELQLSFTQMKALFLLEEAEQVTVKDIAERLSMSFPAMSRSSDRRSREIALLPQGRDALGRLLAAREAALESFAEELSDAERTALHAALLPIAERIASP